MVALEFAVYFTTNPRPLLNNTIIVECFNISVPVKETTNRKSSKKQKN